MRSRLYTPPSVADHHGDSQRARTLGDVEYPALYWTVELDGVSDSLSFDSCPADLAPKAAKGQPSEPSSQVNLIFADAYNESAEELLDWFKDEACSAGDTAPSTETSRPCLKLPAHISKEQRARWHKLAEKRGLISQSQPSSELHVQGLGDNRRLHIMCAADGHNCQGISGRAKQVWKWCQMEGGTMWNISQGEVAAMLQENGQITPDVQQLITKREHAARLAALLQSHKTDEAVQMLTAEPELAWVRDDDSGGYPLHIAVWHGLSPAVECILRVAKNATEQRDERRDTPLMLARKRRLPEIEAMLLAASAKDLPCYTASGGQIAWSAGQSTPYTSRAQPKSESSRGKTHNLRQHTSATEEPPGFSKADARDKWRRPPGL